MPLPRPVPPSTAMLVRPIVVAKYTLPPPTVGQAGAEPAGRVKKSSSGGGVPSTPALPIEGGLAFRLDQKTRSEPTPTPRGGVCPAGNQLIRPPNVGAVQRDAARQRVGGDEVRVYPRAVQVPPPDRPAGLVRPVDVLGVDREAAGLRLTGDEIGIRARAVVVRTANR